MTRLYKAKMWTSGNLPKYAQEKLDGHRIMITRGISGVIRAMTTSFLDISRQLRNYPWWFDIDECLKCGYQIDGELIVIGGTSEDVKHALTNGTEVHFAPFATTMLDDGESLIAVRDFFEGFGLAPPSFVYTGSHTVESLLGYAEMTGREGWVLKDGNYHNWYKLKVEQTIDVVVTGVRPGEGKYKSMIGSFECSLEGRVVANVGGMNDTIRSMPYTDCIGQVIEVKYQRVGNNGRLVLPRFKRWRTDKLQQDCTLDQDKRLKGYYSNASTDSQGT